MGCCCKRKNLENEEAIMPDEADGESINNGKNKFKYDQYKAKNLIRILISDDKYYRHLYQIIDSFNDEAFENFFKGNIKYFENNSYYNEIGIENEREFKFLLFKMEDFQSIILEWYKDDSKHLYIKRLWGENLCISKLNKKNEYELESILQKIFDCSENDEIKYELKNLINSAPESKASQISNYLQYNYEGFYSLIQVTNAYKKGFEKSKYDEKKICQNKIEDTNERIIKSLMPLFKDIIGDDLDFLCENGGGLFNKFQKEVVSNIGTSKTTVINISYDTILKIANKFKNRHLIDIIKDIKDYYNNPLGSIAYLVLSFLNLCTSVKSFYDNIIDYRQKKTEYTERLRKIHENFESHKNEIKNLDFNKINEASKQIINIGNKIQQDQNDIIVLINEVTEELEKVNSKKTKSAVGTASGVIGVLSGIIGFALTGGAIAFLYGAGIIINAIGVGVNSANIVQAKKQIAEYKNILKHSYDKYNEIEKELDYLRDLYNNIKLDYIAININD